MQENTMAKFITLLSRTGHVKRRDVFLKEIVHASRTPLGPGCLGVTNLQNASQAPETPNLKNHGFLFVFWDGPAFDGFFPSLDNTMDQKNFKEWAAPKPLLVSR